MGGASTLLQPQNLLPQICHLATEITMKTGINIHNDNSKTVNEDLMSFLNHSRCSTYTDLLKYKISHNLKEIQPVRDGEVTMDTEISWYQEDLQDNSVALSGLLTTFLLCD